MSEVFFIGDTHFNHKNILNFEPFYRPFQTVGEMNEELIKRWNSVVSPKDKVFHLGDFAMGNAGVEYAKYLNGDLHLILGNHDTAPTSNYLKYFTKVYGSLSFKEYIMTHIPVNRDQSYRFKGNIHGHLHSRNIEIHKLIYPLGQGVVEETNVRDPWYWNVSCEQINLTPVSFDELVSKYE